MNIRQALTDLLSVVDRPADDLTHKYERIEAARQALADGPAVVSIKIKHITDTDPDLSWIGTYSDTPGPDNRTIDRRECLRGLSTREYRYFIATMSSEETGNPESVEQDYKRMEDYNCGEWHMMGIQAVAKVRYPTGRGGYRIEWLSSSGLWGIESDAGDYVKEVEQEELDDLREHLEHFGVDVSNFAELAAKAVVVEE